MSDSPRLGGKSAISVFVLVLAAYVVESQLTQVSSAHGIGSGSCDLKYFAPVRPSYPQISATVLPHVSPAIPSGHPVVSFRPYSYVVHSSFSIIFPLHVAYLSITTGRPVRDYMRGLSLAIKRHIAGNRTETEDAKFPWPRFATMLGLMTVGVTLPGLLWFCAVSLAP